MKNLQLDTVTYLLEATIAFRFKVAQRHSFTKHQ